MATFLQYIFSLKNPQAGGRQSRASLLSDRQIAFDINNTRLEVIKQDLQKGRSLNPNVYQNLGKVKIKKVDNSECSCDISGCSLYKVYPKLPSVMELNGYPQVIVGIKDNFQRTSIERLPWDLKSKYTARMNRWFMLEGELYIVSPDNNLGKNVFIRGIFADPHAANMYKTCDCDNGDSCYDGYEFEYPLPETMWNVVRKLIWDLEFRYMDAHKNDSTNNSKDDAAQSI